MNTIRRFVLSVTVLALIIGISFFFRTERRKPSEESFTENYRYHFALIIPETGNFQWSLFQEGALSYARQNQIALEIHSPGFSNLKELERYLEFVVLSKVDGIITSIPTEDGFSKLIQQASYWGIPVISLDVLAGEKPKFVDYVGVDPYEWGQKAGEALINARSKGGRFAVLTDANYSKAFYQAFHRGLNDKLKSFPQKLFFTTPENRTVSAEEQTYDILMHHPGANTVICMNSKDTLGATRVVVDLNRVNNTVIIGGGLTPELARYIQRGVVFGTVTANPFYLGSNSVAALQAFKEGWPSDNLTHAEVSLITKDNLPTYDREYHLGGISHE